MSIVRPHITGKWNICSKGFSHQQQRKHQSSATLGLWEESISDCISITWHYHVFTHILQGCLTCTGTIVWLTDSQLSNLEVYGWNQYHTTTKLSLKYVHNSSILQSLALMCAHLASSNILCTFTDLNYICKTLSTWVSMPHEWSLSSWHLKDIIA